MTKVPIPSEKKINMQYKVATKNFDYTIIEDQLRTVSLKKKKTSAF